MLLRLLRIRQFRVNCLLCGWGRELRKLWCKDKYDEYQQTKAHTRTTTIADTSKGVSMPLARIAWKEGGGQEGLKAAINYCSKCLHLGPPRPVDGAGEVFVHAEGLRGVLHKDVAWLD